MSLKAFHLFFVFVSILLCLGVGTWAVQAFRAGGGGMPLVLAVACFLGGFGLIVYGLRVRQKLRGLGEEEV